jgi:hypothetical protein
MAPSLKWRRLAVPLTEESILSAQELCDVNRVNGLYRQCFGVAVIEHMTCASGIPPLHPSGISLGIEVRAQFLNQQFIARRLSGHGESPWTRRVTRIPYANNAKHDREEIPKFRSPERLLRITGCFRLGEEAQVDYGQGALTLYRPGKYKRPYLFVMTLKFSGKSFRKVVWKTSQEIWARLHEEAFRALGGCPQYVVLDNLKEGVIRPDLYAPELNPVYAAMLAHYGVVADACRVGDPNRKGTVENAIQHTQATALKGRKFDSIDAQNTFLAHWEERWAALRIHGRKKRQVLEMYREEQPHLRALPLEAFRYFKQETRSVDDAGLVQVEASYYAALPAAPHSEVTVRVFEHDIEIFDATGQLLRRHEKAARRGSFAIEHADRIFNPSRESARLLAKAERIGPRTGALARELFARLGRPGHRALYGLANLPRRYACADIEAVCARLLDAHCFSYAALKRAPERKATSALADAPTPTLTQSGSHIRAITEYQSFWERYSQTHPEEDTDGNVYH